MPPPSARSSPATACSTPGKAATRRRSRSRFWRIRTWCRSRRAPRRTGSSRLMTASSPTASSGAAAPGTTRAISIRSWRPPRRWPSRVFTRSGPSISRSAMTRRSRAPAAPRRSRRRWPRAASGSTSRSTRGCLIADGLVKGLDKPAALIGVAEKGYATLVLTAHATPGHSSMPPRDTAIGMMSAALTRLEEHRLPMQMSGAVVRDVRYAGAGDGAASTASCCRICGCSSRCCCASSKRPARPKR